MNYLDISDPGFRKEAVRFLEDIIRIYSPSGKEAALSEYLAGRMNEFGFQKVRVDGVNNVIGEIGSGEPSILLCGHMDTVPGNQEVKVQENIICGKGACDAKGPLAAQILAASLLKAQGFEGRVVLAAVTDEEGRGAGIKELLQQDLKVGYAIFGEPSGVDNITVGYKGRIALRLTCETSSVHASAPWMSENAVEKLLQVWLAVKDYASRRADDGRRYDSVTACLTRIRGGSADNVTPEKCELTVDIRVPLSLGNKKLLQDLEEIIKGFQTDVSFPKLKLEVLDNTEPFEADITSSLVRAMIRAGLEVRGKRPLLLHKTGTGDMNMLGHALKLPVVTYGPGNAHMSHTSKECIEVDDYLAGIKVYQRTIMNLSAFAK